MTIFNNFIMFNALKDLNLIRTTCTWTDNSLILLQMSQIDWVLVTNQWDALFPKTIVKALHQLSSDHVPLLIDMKGDRFQHVHFHFELM
ncbi:hypothetical protein AMTRI_Chr03g49700 [Amborella trichopoda]